MVTMSEVAAKAGVSQATVSFVLGGRADGFKISQRTRERVLGAAHELGYQRNQLARAVVTGKKPHYRGSDRTQLHRQYHPHYDRGNGGCQPAELSP